MAAKLIQKKEEKKPHMNVQLKSILYLQWFKEKVIGEKKKERWKSERDRTVTTNWNSSANVCSSWTMQTFYSYNKKNGIVIAQSFSIRYTHNLRTKRTNKLNNMRHTYIYTCASLFTPQTYCSSNSHIITGARHVKFILICLCIVYLRCVSHIRIKKLRFKCIPLWLQLCILQKEGSKKFELSVSNTDNKNMYMWTQRERERKKSLKWDGENRNSNKVQRHTEM